MLTAQHIISSCVISNHVAYKDEKRIFENKQVDLPGFLTSVYHYLELKYSKFYKMDNLSKLGWLAAELLLKEGFQAGYYRAEDVGVVLANSSASLDTDIKYFNTIKNIASPALFVYTLPNIMIGEICIRNSFKGENAFFIQDHFDIAFMRGYVGNLFDNDVLKLCVCGWVELLEKDYKAVLYLVEGKENPVTGSAHEMPISPAIQFSDENIKKYIS